MGYFLQLRILLWKNLTLKKRSPFVLMFELFIPLVLFIILLAIRHKQPARPHGAYRSYAKPLPSSGVLPIMQEFCEGGTHSGDGYGFREFHNNKVKTFLQNLQHIAENNNFFEPDFSVDEMEHIPELYRSIIDDPVALHNQIRQMENLHLDAFMTNISVLQEALIHNFSLPAADVQVLLGSKVNFTEVYRLLFGSQLENVLVPGPRSSRRSRHRRDLTDAASLLKQFPNLKLPPTLRSSSPDASLGSKDEVLSKIKQLASLGDTNGAIFDKVLGDGSRAKPGALDTGENPNPGQGLNRDAPQRENSKDNGLVHLIPAIDELIGNKTRNIPVFPHMSSNMKLPSSPSSWFDYANGLFDDNLHDAASSAAAAAAAGGARGGDGDEVDKALIPSIGGALGTSPSENGLVFDIIKEDPSLLLDPEVRDVIGYLMGSPGSLSLDPLEVADALKKVLLSPVGLHHLVCDNDELPRILIPPKANETASLDATERILCAMNSSQWQLLSMLLQRYVDSEKIVTQLHLNHLNVTATRMRIRQFYTNVHEFIAFERNLIELGTVASKLPQDACHKDGLYHNSTESALNATRANSTILDKVDESPPVKPKSNPYKGLIKVWLALQKTLCGNMDQKKLEKFAKTGKISDLGISGSLRSHLSILAYTLYSNPKVLYAPNNTAANSIITKANRTFALIDSISEYAHKWLNVSSEIREYLMLNSTDQNLQDIRQMQLELRNMTALVDFIDDPQIRRFIYHGRVPERDFFLAQIDSVDNAACSWLSTMKGIKLNPFQGFSNEDELVHYFLHHAYKDQVMVFASVVFTNLEENSTDLPPHIVYKIRQNASFTQTTNFVRDRYWRPGAGGGGNYYDRGFVWVQDIIERAIIDVQVGRDVVEPGNYLHQMPVPCYMEDQFLFMIEHVMPLCLTISFVYTVAMLVHSIVHEKEQRLKEVMKMMGLNNSVHWMAWLITVLTQMTITMGVLTAMLKLGNVLTYSNVWIIFLVLEVFALATISFSFLVSVCYSKAKVAAACAGIVYFMSYVPYMYIAIKEEAAGDKISSWTKSIASVFSTTAVGLGAKYFALYEIEGVGVQWNNINKSPQEGDQFTLFLTLLMMVLDTLLYGILTWYIENIHPGSYGLPKPWYFPLTRSYWCGHAKTEAQQCSWRSCCRRRGYQAVSVMDEDQACAMAEGSAESSGNYEAEPSSIPLGVAIDNLSKVYKNGKLAVKNLSVNFYEGQITSFLGHNGAGKTTTMSILTGLFPPSSGYATVYGMDIRTDMEEIRKSLGMCPQHNVLFDKLTVEEHLWFYARLKGMLDGDIKGEMDSMIQDIGLPKKRHNTVDCLSGGMQRKLSVAIAFVAGSRTVILDEPTAGVDPYARRAIWDLLVKYKQGRTIILSTHHMDEADILGDRIAIISNGQMKCCGSSLFLKSTFGEGYHLTLVKKPSEDDVRSLRSGDTVSVDDEAVSRSSHPSFSTKCTEASVTGFLVKHVATAYLNVETPRELHYILPFQELKKGSFEKLFLALDASLDQLHVSSYGVMDTSLEEVFLKVTEHALQGAEEDQAKDSAQHSSAEPVTVPPGEQGDDQNAKDTSSLRSASILLGSLDTYDVHLENLGTPGTTLHRRTRSHGSADLPDAQVAPPVEEEMGPTGILTGPATARSHRRTRSNVSFIQPDPDMGYLTSAQRAIERTHRRTRSNASASANMFPDVELGYVSSFQPFDKTHSRSRSNGSEARSFSSVDDVPLLDDVRDSETGAGDEDDVPLLGDRGAAHDQQMKHRRKTILEAGRGSYTLSGYQLLMQQFIAILAKRFCYTRRNWRGLFSQILLPALFIIVAMTVALTAPQVTDLPAILLSPAQYFNYTQPSGNIITYSNNATDFPEMPVWTPDKGATDLVQTFHMVSGVSATCVLKTPFNSSFDEAILKLVNNTYRNYWLLDQYFEPQCASVFVKGLPLTMYVPPPPTAAPSVLDNQTDIIDMVTSNPQPRYYPQCSCAKDHTGQVCTTGGFMYPMELGVVTSDRLVDISQQNEEDYLLNTYDMHRLHRYLGMSFGLKRDIVPKNFGKGAPTVFRKLAVRHVAESWFNSKGYHAGPISINTLNNAILRANLPTDKGNPAAFGITLFNHPMNNTNNGLMLAYVMQGSDVLIAIFIIIAMSFVPASFVLFLVYERSIKAKHLQIVSGINRVVYWVANYFWDICNYVIPAACCIVILKSFNIPTYVSGTNFPAVVSLFLLYGWSITPMMYPASFVFKEPSTAYISLIVINLFVGITCIITSFLLETFQQNDKDLKRVHDILKQVFLVFPNYCLGRGLMDIAFNEYRNEFYFKTGQYDQMKSPFEWELMARNLVAMAVMGFSFFLITLGFEFSFFLKSKPIDHSTILPPGVEDEDVKKERRRVLRGSGRKDMLRLQNLTKTYVTRKLGRHLAVDRLCLGVPQGECFGLLGVNGAGKTTTFKMLTGDLPPTGGNAFLNRNSILKDIYKVQQNIGYCPQFDALYDELTGREHILLYTRLRGVPCNDQKQVVDWALDKLGLTQVADRLSSTYSGGNKRKLSTAIALIGYPPVIFLDEPTTGMDPHSRRFLWDLIVSLIHDGRSVLLTSHSMEECEALCTRMAIMVNGQFKCLGTAQHLKNRYGDGYTLTVRVKGPNYDREMMMVKRFLERNFPLAKLKEVHHNMVQYELPSEALSLARVFGKMEEAMLDLAVEDYSVSQNTLDNVFINFVKQQQEIIDDSHLDTVEQPEAATVESGQADYHGPNAADGAIPRTPTGGAAAAFSQLPWAETDPLMATLVDEVGMDAEREAIHQDLDTTRTRLSSRMEPINC